jgi:hypothetical protein
VPADHKWVTRAVVANVLTSSIRSLDLSFPKPAKEERAALAKAKEKLLAD